MQYVFDLVLICSLYEYEYCFKQKKRYACSRSKRYSCIVFTEQFNVLLSWFIEYVFEVFVAKNIASSFTNLAFLMLKRTTMSLNIIFSRYSFSLSYGSVSSRNFVSNYINVMM